MHACTHMHVGVGGYAGVCEQADASLCVLCLCVMLDGLWGFSRSFI